MQGKIDVDRYGRNRATYLCIEIAKVRDPDCDGLILDPDNYGDKINHIEIPHVGCKWMPEALTGDDRSILRSELWKLMWVARIARPGEIYDA